MKNKKVKTRFLSILLAALLGLTACGSTTQTPEPTTAPTATEVPTTAPTAEPTATPTPSPTPTPCPIVTVIPDEKVIYLTFDDGPSNTTVEILDLLEKYGFTASFFVIGNRITAKEHRDIMKRAVKLGCTVENADKVAGKHGAAAVVGGDFNRKETRIAEQIEYNDQHDGQNRHNQL